MKQETKECTLTFFKGAKGDLLSYYIDRDIQYLPILDSNSNPIKDEAGNVLTRKKINRDVKIPVFVHKNYSKIIKQDTTWLCDVIMHENRGFAIPVQLLRTEEENEIIKVELKSF